MLWSTLMGSLPQHTIIEFRRYLNRFVYLFPDLSTMANVLRSQFNQHEAFVEPLVAWLERKQVNFVKGAFVSDIEFTESPGRMTVNRLKYERGGASTSVDVASNDIVFVTTGSQAADLSAGTMDTPPGPPPNPGRSWALWKKLAEKHKGFGNPDAFFGDDRIADSRWVTFTVTTTGTEFLDEITNLTHSGPGSGGLLTLKDSNWVISLSIFEQPEVLSQPPGTFVWWGYGLFPEKEGNLYPKPMYQCTGEEILRELLQHLGLKKGESKTEEIVRTSICIPCNMPYVNNIWLPRKRGDRPPVVPEGVTNLGLLGQYVELERDIAFTFEYSTRTAWEAIYRLLKRGPPPPDVYQGQYDLKGVWAATKVFLGLSEDLSAGRLVDGGNAGCGSVMSDAARPERRARPRQRQGTQGAPMRGSSGCALGHGKPDTAPVKPAPIAPQARRSGRADAGNCGCAGHGSAEAAHETGRRPRQARARQARRCGELPRRETDENRRRRRPGATAAGHRAMDERRPRQSDEPWMPPKAGAPRWSPADGMAPAPRRRLGRRRDKPGSAPGDAQRRRRGDGAGAEA